MRDRAHPVFSFLRPHVRRVPKSFSHLQYHAKSRAVLRVSRLARPQDLLQSQYDHFEGAIAIAQFYDFEILSYDYAISSTILGLPNLCRFCDFSSTKLIR